MITLAGPFDSRVFLDTALQISGPAEKLKGLGGTPVSLLMREFIRREQQVLLVSLDSGVQEEVVLEGQGFKICIGPYRPSARARWMDGFALEKAWITRMLEREKPPFVHAHWTYEFALGALDTGIPSLITAHDAPWPILGEQLRHHPRGLPYRAVRTAMAYLAGHRARRMTSVSPYVANHWRRYGFTQAPMAIVANGLPGAYFERPLERTHAGKPTTTFVAILNGGFHGLKNGPGLIKAFTRLAAGTAAVHLILFGSGCGPGEDAEQYVAARCPGLPVSFRGQAPHANVMDCLAHEADVLVHPAFEESFGMTLIDGMACGLPVIGGAASGGVAFTLGFGQAGLLVDVHAPQAMAEAMEKLAKDPECRRIQGAKGRDYAWEHYRIECVADRYEDEYRRLLAQGAASV